MSYTFDGAMPLTPFTEQIKALHDKHEELIQEYLTLKPNRDNGSLSYDEYSDAMRKNRETELDIRNQIEKLWREEQIYITKHMVTPDEKQIVLTHLRWVADLVKNPKMARIDLSFISPKYSGLIDVEVKTRFLTGGLHSYYINISTNRIWMNHFIKEYINIPAYNYGDYEWHYEPKNYPGMTFFNEELLNKE